VACEDCGATRVAMIQMEKGKGTPWELCGKCWVEGVKPNRVGNFKHVEEAPPIKKGEKMGVSAATGETYVASGEYVKRGKAKPPPPERSAAKEDVGSFAFTGGTGTYVPDEDGYW
jgi:hypothetical protein